MWEEEFEVRVKLEIGVESATYDFSYVDTILSWERI